MLDWCFTLLFDPTGVADFFLIWNALGSYQFDQSLSSWLFIASLKTNRNEAIPSTRIPIILLTRRFQCSIHITISDCHRVTNLLTLICWNPHGKSGSSWECMSMENYFAKRFMTQQNLSTFIFNFNMKLRSEWRDQSVTLVGFTRSRRRRVWKRQSRTRIEWRGRKSKRWQDPSLNRLDASWQIASIMGSVLERRCIVNSRFN